MILSIGCSLIVGLCVCDIGEGVVGERGIVFICWCSLRDVLCVVCVVPIVGRGDRPDSTGLDSTGLD